MPPLAVIVILGLATFRVVRLIAEDTITNPLRSRLYGFAWNDDRPVENGDGEYEPTPRAAWRTWLYDLFTCEWCLGVWVGVAAYCAWRWGGDVARAVIAVAALVGVQGALSQFVVTSASNAQVNGRALARADREEAAARERKK